MDPATITTLAAVATQAGNSLAQSSMNRKTREWNEKQYGKQRTDALADWARTNEYNSPLQQMARLKEAGLSPHLIYGGGANSISQPVRSTDTKSWSPQAPQFDSGQVVSQYFGVQQQQNALKIQQEQITSLKLDNMFKEQTLTDRIQTPGINNAATETKIDNMMEDTNMIRLKQSLQGNEYQKLEQEVKQLVTNNQYNALNQQVKLKINGFMADQIQLINQGQINKNNMSAIEAKWKQQIDEWVGPTSGLSTSVIKILLTAITR
jgi:Ni/Co efflux regulator RcnB